MSLGRLVPPYPQERCANVDCLSRLTDAEGVYLYRDLEADKLEQGWTQRVSARSAKGRSVGPLSPRAVAWCVNGALARAADAAYVPMAPWRAVSDEVGTVVSIWNDAPGRTQAEVVAALRRAADKAERA